jgi:hypothetical protein
MENDDRDQPEPAQGLTVCYRYAIRVQGHLDAYWSEWLDGMMKKPEHGKASCKHPLIRSRRFTPVQRSRARPGAAPALMVRSLADLG